MNGGVQSSAVSGVAACGADIFNSLEQNVHGLVAVHSIGFIQVATILGVIVFLELLGSCGEFVNRQTSDGGIYAFGDISTSAVNESLGLDTIGADELNFGVV